MAINGERKKLAESKAETERADRKATDLKEQVEERDTVINGAKTVINGVVKILTTSLDDIRDVANNVESVTRDVLGQVGPPLDVVADHERVVIHGQSAQFKSVVMTIPDVKKTLKGRKEWSNEAIKFLADIKNELVQVLLYEQEKMRDLNSIEAIVEPLNVRPLELKLNEVKTTLRNLEATTRNDISKIATALDQCKQNHKRIPGMIASSLMLPEFPNISMWTRIFGRRRVQWASV